MDNETRNVLKAAFKEQYPHNLFLTLAVDKWYNVQIPVDNITEDMVAGLEYPSCFSSSLLKKKSSFSSFILIPSSTILSPPLLGFFHGNVEMTIFIVILRVCHGSIPTEDYAVFHSRYLLNGQI